jgi:hypothetical protein
VPRRAAQEISSYTLCARIFGMTFSTDRQTMNASRVTRPRQRPLLSGVLGGALCAACSSTTVRRDAGADAATVKTMVDGCSWPAALAQSDSSSGQCRGAARAVLSCTSPTGIAHCVTNDRACDTANSNVTGPLTCQNHCTSTEFGILCGYVGPGSEVTPPPSCRAVLATPEGVTFSCCPCGS